MTASNLGDKRVICQTAVPILNVMFGGDLDGGLTAGVTQVIGDSRTFKTNICVEACAAFLDSFDDSVIVFFDCEFGGMKAFKKRLRPDQLDRVIHVPFEDLEDLKFQMTKMLEDIKEGEHVVFFIDSISQVASKKEVENAIKSNEAADLTRAREMNSFFRIITPKLNIKNIPCLAINSFYEDTSSNYAEVIVKGGKQNFLSSDSIWFVTRSQDKDDNTKELLGWNFNYSMMKSRFCKEKAKMTIHVTYEGGIDPLSSIVELSREAGFLDMPTSGYYQFNPVKLPGVTDRKFRMKELLLDPRLFDATIKHPEFRQFVRRKFSMEEMASGVSSEVTDLDTGEITEKV
jgi:RecA/RadA recombinase